MYNYNVADVNDCWIIRDASLIIIKKERIEYFSLIN